MEYLTSLFAKQLKSSRKNQNICKYLEFGESTVLVLDTRSNMTSKYGTEYFIIIRHYKVLYDTRSNMTSKYGTEYFIIIRHYKWEDCDIDADRQVDIRLQDLSCRNIFQ